MFKPVAPESRSKRRVLLARIIVVLVSLIVLAPHWARSQAAVKTELATFFSPEQLTALEQLVTASESASPAVLEAQHALSVAEAQREIGTRLLDSLTVNVGTGLTGDFYGQSEPRYSVSAGVDIMKLVNVEDKTGVLGAQLAAARAENRAKVAAAYVAYVVAQEAAEAAAHSLESIDVSFSVVKARVEVGEATLSDQLTAQNAVSSSALALLQANSQVIVSLEQLAAVVGKSPKATLAVINGTEEVAKK